VNELLPLSVGLGLFVGLVFTELFGIAAGGMIVPGYIALSLTRPLDVALTLAAGFVTFLLVRAFSSFVLVYGRRRTVGMIFVGFLMGWAARALAHGLPHAADDQLSVIGFIIPGLIAIWFDRQGVVETLTALVSASVAVRLGLVLLVGQDLGP
jgi:gamma-polyglutamate biosynthesis protein CapC